MYMHVLAPDWQAIQQSTIEALEKVIKDGSVPRDRNLYPVDWVKYTSSLATWIGMVPMAVGGAQIRGVPQQETKIQKHGIYHNLYFCLCMIPFGNNWNHSYIFLGGHVYNN